MIRIYKNQKIEFLISSVFPITNPELVEFKIMFYTLDRERSITKTNKDLTEEGLIILEPEELLQLQKGVLNYELTYKDSQNNNISKTETSRYYIMNLLEWKDIEGDIKENSDLYLYINQIITERLNALNNLNK